MGEVGLFGTAPYVCASFGFSTFAAFSCRLSPLITILSPMMALSLKLIKNTFRSCYNNATCSCYDDGN